MSFATLSLVLITATILMMILGGAIDLVRSRSERGNRRARPDEMQVILTARDERSVRTMPTSRSAFTYAEARGL